MVTFCSMPLHMSASSSSSSDEAIRHPGWQQQGAVRAAAGQQLQPPALYVQPAHVADRADRCCHALLAAGHDSDAWKLVGPYMRKYGRFAIANSQLFNPEFTHFFVPGVGSIAYIIADM